MTIGDNEPICSNDEPRPERCAAFPRVRTTAGPGEQAAQDLAHCCISIVIGIGDRSLGGALTGAFALLFHQNSHDAGRHPSDERCVARLCSTGRRVNQQSNEYGDDPYSE